MCLVGHRAKNIVFSAFKGGKGFSFKAARQVPDRYPKAALLDWDRLNRKQQRHAVTAGDLPSHFVACLCCPKRGSCHHGHLNGAMLLVHDKIQFLFQGLAGCIQGQQLGFDAIQSQAYCLVNGIQEGLGKKSSRMSRMGWGGCALCLRLHRHLQRAPRSSKSTHIPRACLG